MSFDRSRNLERTLPGLFSELAGARTPDYLEAAIERASSRPQRPKWTFPERWIPVQLATWWAPTARMPWRQIGVLALIALLLAAALAVYIGSQQQRLPPPFGVARNGLIAYASDGDIFAIDPSSGEVKTLLSGPENDSDPAFSRDGTRLAVVRTRAGAEIPAKDIVVTRADGSDPIVVTPKPIIGGPALVEWASDSRSLLVGASDGSAIWLFDATKTAEPRTLVADADTYLQPFQPPNGSAILLRRVTAAGPTLIKLDLATLHETLLARGSRTDDVGAARWSPDGSKVLYNSTPEHDLASQRLFIVNADGTGTEQITNAPGTWYDIDASWSPDGSRIAFNRYQQLADASAIWEVRPIAIYSIADRTVRSVGPLPREARAKDPNPGDSTASNGEGFDFDWSPDGNSLIAIPGEGNGHPVVIDTRDGSWRNLAPVVQPASTKQNWQRVAP